MRIETILLGLGVVSIVAAGALPKQGAKHPQSFAEKLFSKAVDADYTGSLACAECHEKKVDLFVHSAHYAFSQVEGLSLQRKGCEGCHGPGKLHTKEDNPEVIAFRKMTPKESSAACLRCHESTMRLSQWHRTEHSRGNVSCVSCHQIHPDSPNEFNEKNTQVLDIRKLEFAATKGSSKLLKADEVVLCASCHRAQAAEFRRPSRHPVPEGRMICSDCHEPHPTGKSAAKHNPLKQACAKCHAEHAGPFAYEHDPVAGHSGNGCVECHRPHGSPNSNLLDRTSRGLCAQCHSDKTTSHYPGRTCWTAGCHVALHGSNSDPQFLRP